MKQKHTSHIEREVTYHDASRIISLDFDDTHNDILCVHGAALTVDVMETHCLDKESLVTIAIALPDFEGGIFAYFDAKQARELATSLLGSADHLDQITASRLVERSETIN